MPTYSNLASSDHSVINFYSLILFLQPQWMAPEVIRNEPSNEKYELLSLVFYSS